MHHDATTQGQGQGHDMFGLGLCKLHVFTGHAPYDEILHDVERAPDSGRNSRRFGKTKPSALRLLCQAMIRDVDNDGISVHTFYHLLSLSFPLWNSQAVRTVGFSMAIVCDLRDVAC